MKLTRNNCVYGINKGKREQAKGILSKLICIITSFLYKMPSPSAAVGIANPTLHLTIPAKPHKIKSYGSDKLKFISKKMKELDLLRCVPLLVGKVVHQE